MLIVGSWRNRDFHAIAGCVRFQVAARLTATTVMRREGAIRDIRDPSLLLADSGLAAFSKNIREADLLGIESFGYLARPHVSRTHAPMCSP